MSKEKKRITIVGGIAALLFVSTAVLAYMVFETRQQVQALTLQQMPGPAVAVQGTPDKVGVQPADPDGWQLNIQPNARDPWDPFHEFEQMQRQIDSMFNDAFGRFGQAPGFGKMFQDMSFTPRMDLVDKGDHYEMSMDIPGAEKSTVNVSVENGVLSVSASTEQGSQQNGSGHILRQERRIGQFSRQITLPDDVDPNSMKSGYKNGVLTITLQKST